MVSLNHRLNVLGYLDLSPFGEKYEGSANAGNLDLIAALSLGSGKYPEFWRRSGQCDDFRTVRRRDERSGH